MAPNPARSADQTDSDLPVAAAAVQGFPKHGVVVPQRSATELTCSPISRANETLATDDQTDGLETRADPKIHERETPSKLDENPGQSISVMWGGDKRNKVLPRSVTKGERVVSTATPTKRGEEPSGKERTKDGGEEDRETQKTRVPGSAEQTEHASAASEALCAEVIYQQETNKSRGGGHERTTSDSTKHWEISVTENPIKRAEVPPLPCSARREKLASRLKPRTNVEGKGEAARELDETVIGQSEKRRQSNDNGRADTVGGRIAELSGGSSGVASPDGCTDLASVTPPKLTPVGSLFVLPGSEIDKMKDREERFGQPSKPNHLDCSEPSGSCRDNDVHDDECGGGSRREEGSRSETARFEVAAHLEVAGTISVDDTWKEKLEKRKARFGTPPLDRSRMKISSGPISEAPRPAASDAAAKMARRAERFRATSDGPRACLVTAPAGTPDPRGASFSSSESIEGTCLVTAPAGMPDPRGGYFAPPGSVEGVALPQTSAAGGGNADAPLPQRRKRRRDRLSSLATVLASAKQAKNSSPGPTLAPEKLRGGNAAGITAAAAKRSRTSPLSTTFKPDKRKRANTAGAGKEGDEGRVALVSAVVKPASIAGVDKGKARGTTKMKNKPMKQRVRFLPVVSMTDGSSFVQGGCTQSPPPRRRATTFLASPPPPPSPAFSPSSTSARVPVCIERGGVTLERVGVAPRSFPKKNRKTPQKCVGEGSMEKKMHSNTPPKYVSKAGVTPGTFPTNHRKSPPKFVGKVGVAPGAFTTKHSKTSPKYVGNGSMEKKKHFKTPPKYVGKDSVGKKAADQASKMRDRQKRFAQESRTPRKSTACSS